MIAVSMYKHFFICRPCPVLQASRQALSFKYFVLLLIQKVHPKKNVVILCAKVLTLDVVNKLLWIVGEILLRFIDVHNL